MPSQELAVSKQQLLSSRNQLCASEVAASKTQAFLEYSLQQNVKVSVSSARSHCVVLKFKGFSTSVCSYSKKQGNAAVKAEKRQSDVELLENENSVLHADLQTRVCALKLDIQQI
jgi:hypothetical protein